MMKRKPTANSGKPGICLMAHNNHDAVVGGDSRHIGGEADHGAVVCRQVPNRTGILVLFAIWELVRAYPLVNLLSGYLYCSIKT